MPRTIAKVIFGAVLVTSLTSCATGTSNIPGTNLLSLINQQRAEAGCDPVAGDNRLRSAAERFVIDMRDNGAHLKGDGHTGSDGSTPLQRIVQAGFQPASRTGEIVYWRDNLSALPPSTTPEQESVNWWMKSETHRAIMLDCRFTHAGVGVVYPGGNKWYAVVDFGRH